jgi:superfamily II DNA or RNA helicase
MSGFVLRKYQKQAVEKILDCWERGKSCLLAMATGTGKTEVFLSATERWLGEHGGRALIVAHRVELLDQPVERMAAHFPKLFAEGVGVVQGNRDKHDRRVVVGSIQTLRSPDRLDRVMDGGRIGVLVIDEAHHALAKTYRELVARVRRRYPEVRIVGATATPKGGSGKYGLKAVFDEVAYRLPMNEAIELGALVPFKAVAIDVPASFADVEQVAGDYRKDVAAELMSAARVHRAIVRCWRTKAEGRPTLAFAYTVAQAKALADAFRAEGVAARCVHAGTPPEKRASILKRFRAGKIPVLTNVGIYGEGVDVPVASCMVQARPTCSDAVYAQMLGRVLRTFEGKKDALVIDARPRDARDLFMAGDLLEGSEAFDWRDRRLVWHDDGKALSAAIAKGYAAVAVRMEDGTYQVLRVRTDHPQRVWLLGEATEWDQVLAYVDRVGGYEWYISSRKAAWRRKPVTPKQERYMRAMGWWCPGIKTAGQAAAIITARKAVKAILANNVEEWPVDLSAPAEDDIASKIRNEIASTRRRRWFARRRRPIEARFRRLIQEGGTRKRG